MCHGNEEWWKTRTEIDLSVQNWHEQFEKFWPEHSKIPKIYTLISCFWGKYVKHRGVMFDDTEVDAKFEGNWLVLSKNFRLMDEK